MAFVEAMLHGHRQSRYRHDTITLQILKKIYIGDEYLTHGSVMHLTRHGFILEVSMLYSVVEYKIWWNN